ncbi:MAG: glutamate-5-semialdehyde dehydrogenase [Anaerolinea sp.]|nr:glutamate-5-semialdehyde dehydrogenase [Anaerolinea sp.]
MGKRAKAAAAVLAHTPCDVKNAALEAIANALEAYADSILAENALDLADGAAKGLSSAMLDRLSLANRIPGIAADVRNVATLPDPVGVTFDATTMPNGLQVSKRRTPLGVVGVIYESRPNVTVDVIALCLKSGNAMILRGGSETFRSNMALVSVIKDALAPYSDDIPPDTIQYIEDTDRRYVLDLLKLHQYVDLIIPRGGNALHTFCRENSMIPVITGGIGICHLYVDETALLDDALKIVHNAKVQRPSVCNALEVLLVHEKIAADFIPRVVEHLGASGVTFRAEPRALACANGDARVLPAAEGDFDTEWLALILSLKVVTGLDDAMTHIRTHSTAHSDGILTQNMTNAARFVESIDSAAVYVNASTRFTDGAQLGLGAEIAVSTQKLHVRGPMALEALTTYKWVIIGEGHVRP